MLPRLPIRPLTVTGLQLLSRGCRMPSFPATSCDGALFSRESASRRGEGGRGGSGRGGRGRGGRGRGGAPAGPRAEQPQPLLRGSFEPSQDVRGPPPPEARGGFKSQQAPQPYCTPSLSSSGWLRSRAAALSDETRGRGGRGRGPSGPRPLMGEGGAREFRRSREGPPPQAQVPQRRPEPRFEEGAGRGGRYEERNLGPRLRNARDRSTFPSRHPFWL